MSTEEVPICRICLNSTFESDVSKLDRSSIVSGHSGHHKPVYLSEHTLSKILSPCLCSGSIGRLHLGCLLLEVQFRRSATCQLCQTPYKGVIIRRTGVGVRRLFAYLASHLLRCLATLALVLAVPLLTTIWFCNRIKFCSLQVTTDERGEGNRSYRVVANDGRGGKGTSDGQPPLTFSRQPVHPLLVLIFTYHADVLWINVVNLLLIQLILHNLEHYQHWAAEHRPQVVIHLTQ